MKERVKELIKAKGKKGQEKKQPLVSEEVRKEAKRILREGGRSLSRVAKHLYKHYIEEEARLIELINAIKDMNVAFYDESQGRSSTLKDIVEKKEELKSKGLNGWALPIIKAALRSPEKRFANVEELKRAFIKTKLEDSIFHDALDEYWGSRTVVEFYGHDLLPYFLYYLTTAEEKMRKALRERDVNGELKEDLKKMLGKASAMDLNNVNLESVKSVLNEEDKKEVVAYAKRFLEKGASYKLRYLVKFTTQLKDKAYIEPLIQRLLKEKPQIGGDVIYKLAEALDILLDEYGNYTPSKEVAEEMESYVKENITNNEAKVREKLPVLIRALNKREFIPELISLLTETKSVVGFLAEDIWPKLPYTKGYWKKETYTPSPYLIPGMRGTPNTVLQKPVVRTTILVRTFYKEKMSEEEKERLKAIIKKKLHKNEDQQVGAVELIAEIGLENEFWLDVAPLLRNNDIDVWRPTIRNIVEKGAKEFAQRVDRSRAKRKNLFSQAQYDKEELVANIYTALDSLCM